jgi:putative hydrolase of the HAD superfamily
MLIDLDDTIVSYSSLAEGIWRGCCERFASRADGLQPETLYKAVQESRRWFWSDPDRHRQNRLDMRRAQRKVVAGALRRLEVDDPSLVADIADTFTDEREAAVKPLPGAIEALARIKESGVRTALITNGAQDAQRRKIERFALEGYFDAILIEGELGYGKPDKRVYREALRLLSASTDEAWCVGDNLEWEVAVPQSLGLYAIWHDPTGKGLPDDCDIRPDRIIRSLSELV